MCGLLCGPLASTAPLASLTPAHQTQPSGDHSGAPAALCWVAITAGWPGSRGRSGEHPVTRGPWSTRFLLWVTNHLGTKRPRTLPTWLHTIRDGRDPPPWISPMGYEVSCMSPHRVACSSLSCACVCVRVCVCVCVHTCASVLLNHGASLQPI